MRIWIRYFDLRLLFVLIFFSTVGCFSEPIKYEFSEDTKTHAEPDSVDAWKDSLKELVFPFLDGHDTEYTEGYDEAVFRELKVGTPSEEVLRTLGQPFSVRDGFLGTSTKPDGTSLWDYSKHGPKSQSYFCRVLEFDASDHLVRKIATFNLD